VTRDFVGARAVSKFEYDILFSFVLLSAICLWFADDFLLFYLGIELQCLCFYVFATFSSNSEFSTESGLKYFVFGDVISCFLLMGFALIYISFGSISFESLLCLSETSNNSFLFSGVLFILFAFLFKVGAAPFHTWLCDVYDGALISVTLLFAAVPKIIIFSLIVKIFFLVFYDFSSHWSSFFLFASVLSIAVGSISAIYQKRLKRLFAYSTIAHTGFILLGIVGVSPEGVQSLIFYLVIYSGLTILLFSLLIFAIISVNRFPTYLATWTASGLKNYVFVITFTLVLFSIAGIPPLAGFFSKFLILLSFVSNEYYVTSLVIVMISSVACFYYIRIIKTFFFVKSSKNSFWISSTKRLHSEYVIGFLLFVNLFFVLYPDVLSLFATVVTTALL
jgi:NADH-quinone oxidoreductase subunit N